jgi:hypothetical protein
MAIRLTAAEARKLGIGKEPKPGKKKKINPYREIIDAWCTRERLPMPKYEFRFCNRLWRLDVGWIDLNVALEIEGGAWVQGRHTRGSGFIKDIEKYNAAVLSNWRLFRCTPKMLSDGSIFKTLKEALT